MIYHYATSRRTVYCDRMHSFRDICFSGAYPEAINLDFTLAKIVIILPKMILILLKIISI